MENEPKSILHELAERNRQLESENKALRRDIKLIFAVAVAFCIADAFLIVRYWL